MAQIVEQYKDEKYPESKRFMVGLNHGWEAVKAARVAERAAKEAAAREATGGD